MFIIAMDKCNGFLHGWILRYNFSTFLLPVPQQNTGYRIKKIIPTSSKIAQRNTQGQYAVQNPTQAQGRRTKRLH